jgi:hypothetical protein
MRKLICILFLSSIAFVSCEKVEQQQEQKAEVLDKVKSSDTYKKYVEAYNDYLACKQRRPQLTQEFMDKKITQEEFTDQIQRSGRVCNIKKDIYNRYYRLLEAEFDRAVAEQYKIEEEAE